MPPVNPDDAGHAEVRARILDTACRLFYARGVRAVGVDLIVAEAGVAKTSLYRHFGTKDDLVAAFLKREDEDFWSHWDGVRDAHPGDALGELKAQLDWIGERVARADYRGCPQINVAAEFPEREHPARKVAAAHKRALRDRLAEIAQGLGVARPDELAGQLSLLINGGFVSADALKPGEATAMLQAAARSLIEAGRR
ncbi:TetR family transcriptional regulator [Allostella sp. ATCC 35155]|nr:TetR family transcriptional regulator [Stella sp. ATCC 35155]